MDERIRRVSTMEVRLNRITDWLKNGNGDVSEDVRLLNEYYQSPLWRADFEADEAGLIPDDVPHGVLSEDAAYNALTEYDERIKQIFYEEACQSIPCGRYRHFKGNEYEVVGIARHSETEEPMVVYKALYDNGSLWVRPASMWLETVERDGRTYQRFERIEE